MLQTVIAATATPLFALANPGAIYVQQVTAQPPAASLKTVARNRNVPKVARPMTGIAKREAAPKGVCENGKGVPGNATLALGRLRKFESWEANWDGDGAPAPDRGALEGAGSMLGFLTSKLGKTPAVSLNGEGEPTFTVLRDDFELLVTLVSKTEAAFFVAAGQEERSGQVDFDGRALPLEIALAVAELKPIVA